MKNVYITPEVSVCTLSKNDILDDSDVIIDGSGLLMKQTINHGWKKMFSR